MSSLSPRSAGELQSLLQDVDSSIIQLLNQRMECSLQVGRIKAANELKAKQSQPPSTPPKSASTTTPPTPATPYATATGTVTGGTPAEQQNALVYIPSREKLIFDKIIAYNASLNGHMSSDLVCSIWREIMSASIALQRTTHVAIPGNIGSFPHAACKQRFGASIGVIPCDNVHDVFTAVLNGRAQYGILPFQRQSVGNDAVTMSLLSQPDNKLHIYAELYMSHQYYLMSTRESPASKQHKQIKRVYGTIDSIQHCTVWLQHELPGVSVCIEQSMQACVAKCKSNRSYSLLGSQLCATEYNLDIICEVSDSVSVPAYETVRYVVIANKIDVRTGEDKTFVLFELFERSGALHDALNIFKSHGANMTRLESKANAERPTKWDYVFAELDGHPDDDKIKAVLSELKPQCISMKVLGCCIANPANSAYSPYKI